MVASICDSYLKDYAERARSLWGKLGRVRSVGELSSDEIAWLESQVRRYLPDAQAYEIRSMPPAVLKRFFGALWQKVYLPASEAERWECIGNVLMYAFGFFGGILFISGVVQPSTGLPLLLVSLLLLNIAFYGYRKREAAKRQVQDIHRMAAAYISPEIMALRDALAQVRGGYMRTGGLRGGSSYPTEGGASGEKDCFITTAVVELLGRPDDCWEMNAIRRIRDEYLRKTPEGIKLLREYREIGPKIVEMMMVDPERHAVARAIHRYVLRAAALADYGQYEKAVEEYIAMVKMLRRRYAKPLSRK